LRDAPKICRFDAGAGTGRVGLEDGETHVLDLSAAGIARISDILESADPAGTVKQIDRGSLPRLEIGAIRFAPPVDRQEVWAAGVTYLRSKAARMEESDFSATAYDRVYDAERPEIFFKSIADKVVATGDAVGIRRDARWSVPEPELALVINSRGEIVGATIGNDMSSRDIEGENPLYLPQAKTYSGSAALGPCLVIADEPPANSTRIEIVIVRAGTTVFSGSTDLGQMKRALATLAEYLYRDNEFPRGAWLMTGTGIVPPDAFTLEHGDEIRITIEPVGTLTNTVA
jgi:2-dehydro-3-deoxy-D-arabinonate dehydratase